MKVIGVQPDIAWEDKPANFRKVGGLLTAAAIEPGALIVLPEMFATGYSMNVPAVREGPGGRTESLLAGVARDCRCWVVGGVVTPGSGGRGRNEAVAMAPDGREIARYCKMHPFSFAGEDHHYEPGEAVVTFPAGEFTAAAAICYDLRFPELFRAAVRRGAGLLIVIANWPAAREDHWLALLTARAVENQAYVVGVNRCGRDPHAAYSGRSRVVDPRGRVLADAGGAECTFTADLDLAVLEDYRGSFPALADMRADLAGGPPPPAQGSAAGPPE